MKVTEALQAVGISSYPIQAVGWTLSVQPPKPTVICRRCKPVDNKFPPFLGSRSRLLGPPSPSAESIRLPSRSLPTTTSNTQTKPHSSHSRHFFHTSGAFLPTPSFRTKSKPVAAAPPTVTPRRRAEVEPSQAT